MKPKLKTMRLAKPKEEKKATAEFAGFNLQIDSIADISYANKDHLVYEFSARWWFALPSPWPPLDYDYTVKLAERHLR